MATKGCNRLLSLPRRPGKSRPVECLRATLAALVAPHIAPSQSALGRVGSHDADLRAMDSRSTRFTSLSYCSLSRHSSKVGAVCVKALVRICAGGNPRGLSLPRHLGLVLCFWYLEQGE